MKILAEIRIDMAVTMPKMARTDTSTSSRRPAGLASGTRTMTVTPMPIAMKYKRRQRTFSHFGTMRNSSEKRNASFLRRNRIMRRRSFQESPKLCPMLGPVVLILSPSKPLGADQSLGNIGAGPLLQQDRARRHDARHKPPKHHARLPDNLGQSQFAASPRKAAPNQRRTGKTEQPGNSGNGPEHEAPGVVCRKFVGAQAHTQLGARRQIRRKLDIQAAKRVQSVLGLNLRGGAGFTFGEMRREPGLLFGGNSLDSLLRDHLHRARVKIAVHAAPPLIAPRKASNPR